MPKCWSAWVYKYHSSAWRAQVPQCLKCPSSLHVSFDFPSVSYSALWVPKCPSSTQVPLEFFVLASNRFSKKLNSFRSSHQKVFYKMELHSSKSCKIAGFQPLVSAAMWTILHVAGILDSPLDLNIGITMVTSISVLFLFTKFILIFQLKY